MTDAEGARPRDGDWGTHEVVCRGDPADEIATDTRLVGVAAEFGDEALVAMSTEDVSDRSPHTQRILDEELERVPADETDDTGRTADPTWLATLPADADALQRALTVDAEATDSGRLGTARWRVWDVASVTVQRDGEPIYRSIPHHSQFEMDADRAPGLVERAHEQLADLPCAVVPAGPLATWDDGGLIDNRVLRFETGSGVSLRHVERVVVARERRELVVDWEPVDDRIDREPNRLLRGILRAFTWTVGRMAGTESPPRRLALDDGDAFEDALAGLQTVRERVGYDFAITEG